MTVWLLRHAETEWSRARRHTGRTDLPLTPAGEAAARAVAPRLAEHAFARVLASPLQRARRTAALAGFPDAELRDDLMEWDYGEVEGITSAEWRERTGDPGWRVWTGPVPGGETVQDVGARADRVLAEVAGVDGDVLLVAHAHLLRVLTARWLGQPPAFGGSLRLEPAALAALGFEGDARVLLRWGV